MRAIRTNALVSLLALSVLVPKGDGLKPCQRLTADREYEGFDCPDFSTRTSTNPKSFEGWFTIATGTIFNIGVSLVTWTLEVFTYLFLNTWYIFTKLAEVLWNAFRDCWNWAGMVLSETGKWFWNLITGIFHWFIQAIQDVYKFLKKRCEDVALFFINAADDILNWWYAIVWKDTVSYCAHKADDGFFEFFGWGFLTLVFFVLFIPWALLGLAVIAAWAVIGLVATLVVILLAIVLMALFAIVWAICFVIVILFAIISMIVVLIFLFIVLAAVVIAFAILILLLMCIALCLALIFTVAGVVLFLVVAVLAIVISMVTLIGAVFIQIAAFLVGWAIVFSILAIMSLTLVACFWPKSQKEGQEAEQWEVRFSLTGRADGSWNPNKLSSITQSEDGVHVSMERTGNATNTSGTVLVKATKKLSRLRQSMGYQKAPVKARYRVRQLAEEALKLKLDDPTVRVQDMFPAGVTTSDADEETDALEQCLTCQGCGVEGLIACVKCQVCCSGKQGAKNARGLVSKVVIVCLTICFEWFMFYIDLIIVARMYLATTILFDMSLPFNVGFDVDLGLSLELTFTWIGLAEVGRILRTIAGFFIGIYDFAFQLSRKVQELMDFKCPGTTTTFASSQLVIGTVVLYCMQEFKLKQQLAHIIVSTTGTGGERSVSQTELLRKLIRAVQGFTIKVIEFMMSAGSSSFVLLFRPLRKESCDFEGDVLLHIASVSFLACMTIIILVFAPQYLLGPSKLFETAKGFIPGKGNFLVSFKKLVEDHVALLKMAFGFWTPTAFRLAGEKMWMPEDAARTEILCQLTAKFAAAGYVMFPLGAIMGRLTDNANKGFVIRLYHTPQTLTDKQDEWAAEETKMKERVERSYKKHSNAIDLFRLAAIKEDHVKLKLDSKKKKEKPSEAAAELEESMNQKKERLSKIEEDSEEATELRIAIEQLKLRVENEESVGGLAIRIEKETSEMLKMKKYQDTLADMEIQLNQIERQIVVLPDKPQGKQDDKKPWCACFGSKSDAEQRLRLRDSRIKQITDETIGLLSNPAWKDVLAAAEIEKRKKLAEKHNFDQKDGHVAGDLKQIILGYRRNIQLEEKILRTQSEIKRMEDKAQERRTDMSEWVSKHSECVREKEKLRSNQLQAKREWDGLELEYLPICERIKKERREFQQAAQESDYSTPPMERWGILEKTCALVRLILIITIPWIVKQQYRVVLIWTGMFIVLLEIVFHDKRPPPPRPGAVADLLRDKNGHRVALVLPSDDDMERLKKANPMATMIESVSNCVSSCVRWLSCRQKLREEADAMSDSPNNDIEGSYIKRVMEQEKRAHGNDHNRAQGEWNDLDKRIRAKFNGRHRLGSVAKNVRYQHGDKAIIIQFTGDADFASICLSLPGKVIIFNNDKGLNEIEDIFEQSDEGVCLLLKYPLQTDAVLQAQEVFICTEGGRETLPSRSEGEAATRTEITPALEDGSIEERAPKYACALTMAGTQSFTSPSQPITAQDKESHPEEDTEIRPPPRDTASVAERPDFNGAEDNPDFSFNNAVAQPQPQTAFSTTLTTLAKVGDTKLDVASADHFKVGHAVTIDAGTAFEEDNQIKGFGSILLVHPLRYEHGAGTTIRKKAYRWTRLAEFEYAPKPAWLPGVVRANDSVTPEQESALMVNAHFQRACDSKLIEAAAPASLSLQHGAGTTIREETYRWTRSAEFEYAPKPAWLPGVVRSNDSVTPEQESALMVNGHFQRACDSKLIEAAAPAPLSLQHGAGTTIRKETYRWTRSAEFEYAPKPAWLPGVVRANDNVTPEQESALMVNGQFQRACDNKLIEAATTAPLSLPAEINPDEGNNNLRDEEPNNYLNTAVEQERMFGDDARSGSDIDSKQNATPTLAEAALQGPGCMPESTGIINCCQSAHQCASSDLVVGESEQKKDIVFEGKISWRWDDTMFKWWSLEKDPEVAIAEFDDCTEEEKKRPVFVCFKQVGKEDTYLRFPNVGDAVVALKHEPPAPKSVSVASHDASHDPELKPADTDDADVGNAINPNKAIAPKSSQLLNSSLEEMQTASSPQQQEPKSDYPTPEPEKEFDGINQGDIKIVVDSSKSFEFNNDFEYDNCVQAEL